VIVQVNGEPRDVDEGTTVATLVQSLGLTAPHVAIELNLDVVPRAQHAETYLRDGDRLEIVTLVGGG
jgi:sulfur carrier protein